MSLDQSSPIRGQYSDHLTNERHIPDVGIAEEPVGSRQQRPSGGEECLQRCVVPGGLDQSGPSIQVT